MNLLLNLFFGNFKSLTGSSIRMNVEVCITNGNLVCTLVWQRWRQLLLITHNSSVSSTYTVSKSGEMCVFPNQWCIIDRPLICRCMANSFSFCEIVTILLLSCMQFSFLEHFALSFWAPLFFLRGSCMMLRLGLQSNHSIWNLRFSFIFMITTLKSWLELCWIPIPSALLL